MNIRKLREFRLDRNFTITRLAREVGYSGAMMGNVENGKQALSLEVFSNICKVLQLDPLEIMELLQVWPLPHRLAIRFRTACKLENTTPLQALIDFMEVYCAD